LVTLTAAIDEPPFEVKIGISASERFISVYGYTWKLIKLLSYYLLSCTCFVVELQL